jgi:hypothetical protein
MRGRGWGRFGTVAVAVAIGFAAGSANAHAAKPECLGAKATIVGTNDDDVLRGTKKADVFVAKDGDDDVIAKKGDDLICGGDGDDVLSGDSGADKVDGGNGVDECPKDADDKSVRKCEPTLAIVSVPPGIEEGNTGQGTVMLSAQARSGGQFVELTSEVPGRVIVPSEVLIPSGETSGEFEIEVTDGPAIASVEIAGASGQSEAVDTVEVLNALELDSLTLDRDCIYVDGSVNTPVGNVTLDQPVSSPTTVPVTSNSSALTVANNSSTVAQGQTSSAVLVTANDVGTATLSAQLGAGPVKTAQIEIRSLATLPDLEPAIGLSPNPAIAGSSAIGTVTLDCGAPAGGALVSLSSSNPDVTVNSSVTIMAGATSATFLINAGAGALGESSTISATYDGSQASGVLQVSD